MNKCTYIGTHNELCTHTRVEAQQYCELHYPVVYNVGSAHRKRHKDIARAASIQDIGSLFNDVVAELEHTGELDL
jgi:hypothetical protein